MPGGHGPEAPPTLKTNVELGTWNLEHPYCPGLPGITGKVVSVGTSSGKS